MSIFQRHPWWPQWCHQWSMESIIPQKHRSWATLHQWCQLARSFNHKVHLVLQGMRLEIASHAPSFTQRDARVVRLPLRHVGFMYGHAMFCKICHEKCWVWFLVLLSLPLSINLRQCAFCHLCPPGEKDRRKKVKHIMARLEKTSDSRCLFAMLLFAFLWFLNRLDYSTSCRILVFYRLCD